MKKINILFILACLSQFKNLSSSDQIISLFFQPFPYTQQSTLQRLARPGKIAKHTIEGLAKHNPVSGIFASYAGYLDASDISGHVIFPRKHEKPFFHFVITNKLIPIAMMNNTIHHWEIDENSPAEFFTAERQKDESTGLYFWNIQPETIPADKKIPLEAFIVIAKPSKVFIPTGVTTTNDRPNLVLPNIYIKQGINITGNALFMLKISHLFSPVNLTYKKQSNRYSSQIETDQ